MPWRHIRTVGRLTVAARALRYTAFHWHTSVFETLEIVFSVLGPSSLLYLTLGLVREIESDLICLVQFALQINEGMCRRQLLLLLRVRSASMFNIRRAAYVQWRSGGHSNSEDEMNARDHHTSHQVSPYNTP